MTGTPAQRQLRGRLPELQGAGVIDYDVLDEPTSGLHLADIDHLLALLDGLVEIVIKHHQAVIAHADWIIDLGPGAGQDGGLVVFEGTPADLVAERSTLTGRHLAGYVTPG